MNSVKQMGGLVAGVVFFRWPAWEESLTMQPDEAIEAAGEVSRGTHGYHVELVDGRCAAVSCADVYLRGADPFSPEPLRLRIHASAAMEYFLPERGMPVMMSGPTDLELRLPPYCGRGLLYLGRAVSLERSGFAVEAQQ